MSAFFLTDLVIFVSNKFQHSDLTVDRMLLSCLADGFAYFSEGPMEKGSRVILDWASRVADIYRRLLQIQEEHNSLIQELETIRAGAPVATTANIENAIVGGNSNPPAFAITGSATGVVGLPSGGTAKRVHEFMKENPGITYTPSDVTNALGLGPEGKPMVNTALSRLRRAGVLQQPKSGEYVFPKPDNLQDTELKEPERKEEEPNLICNRSAVSQQ